MKIYIALLLCFLFLILNGCSYSSRPAYSTPGGEFSFVPPENWVMREMPGFKYQFAFAPPDNNFNPNINFVDQEAAVNLDDYVAGNIQALHNMARTEGRSLKIISQQEFTTDFKRRGARLVTETAYNDVPVRQTFYFFEGKGSNKFVITCTVPSTSTKPYDQICDSSIRTFKTSAD